MGSKPSLIADQLEDIQKRLAVIYAEKEALIKKTVADCDHPLEAIRELPYVSDFVCSQRPWLICSKCGYTAEGWGCGYKKLRHAEYTKPPTITSEQWSAMSTITVRQERE